MQHTARLSLSLLLSLTSACGLINVNGKPLGGGSSPSSSSSPSYASPTSSRGSQARSTADIDAERQRDYDAHKAANDAVMGKQPAWCKQLGLTRSKDVDLADFNELDTSGDGNQAVEFAEVMCSATGEHRELVPKVMEIRTRWMKQHGFDESDFQVVLFGQKGYGPDVQRYGDFDGPVGQIESANMNTLDVLGARASMLAYVGYVSACLRSGAAITENDQLLVEILCTREQLDGAKAAAEIEATKDLNIATRHSLRMLVRTTLEQYAQARADLAAKAKADPAVARLIAIADAQRKEWATPSSTRKKLVELIESMEAATAANKRSAFAGCEATTRAAWAEVVKGASVPTVSLEHVFSAMIDATFRSPEAYLAFEALRSCAIGNDADFSPRFPFLGGDTIRRGPRTSTEAAWYAASGEIAFDRRELSMQKMIGALGGSEGHRYERVTAGTIESVTAKGNKIVITFKQQIGEREDCVSWKKTNRIESISAGGAVNYENVCLARGRVKYDKTPDDISIGSFIGQGLKPGMFLFATVDAIAIVATSGVSSSKPTWLFGVSLTK